MPQFQILVSGTFCAAAITILIVFTSTFNVGFAPVASIIFFAISAGLLYWTFFTADGKRIANGYNQHLKEVAQKQQERTIEVKQLFDSYIEIVKSNCHRETRHNLLPDKILSCLEEKIGISSLFDKFSRTEKCSTIEMLLSSFPESNKFYNFAFREIKKGVMTSSSAYSMALDVLSKNPSEPRAKQFVLEVGRWHFAKSRKDKKVTIYDEQAIQNDIQVRLK